MKQFFAKRFQDIRTYSDNVLIKKSQNGDKEAFGKIYMKYLDPIYRYIYFRVNQNRQEAEDLTELVFFKALERVDKYKENGHSFRAWLYTIARNTVVDHWRRGSNTSILSIDVENGEKTPEENLIFEEENKDLLEAVDQLNEEQRQLVVMKFIEGLENKEIAEILNKREDAIRAMQYRALKQLRKIMEASK